MSLMLPHRTQVDGLFQIKKATRTLEKDLQFYASRGLFLHILYPWQYTHVPNSFLTQCDAASPMLSKCLYSHYCLTLSPICFKACLHWFILIGLPLFFSSKFGFISYVFSMLTHLIMLCFTTSSCFPRTFLFPLHKLLCLQDLTP